ncbi:MAG: hypothetical protein GXO10_01620 [Crenarchaeota archaeon]|nr:hypothetical protein [Thermoproteota archaeon]
MTNVSIVLDLEGVLTPPGTDFARKLVERCGKDATKLLKIFDTYDDYRWIKERLCKGGKYQTGTTPFFSLLIAYSCGLSSKDVEQLAEEEAEHVASNEFINMVNELSKRYGVTVTTSSYHVFANKVTTILGLDSSKVFSTCNTRVDGVVEEDVIEVLEKMASREEVRKIIENICNIAKQIIEDRLPISAIDVLIERIENRDLRNYLTMRLVEQIGIAGSKFKARIVRLLKNNSIVIYVGDSIVDSEACAEANASISINTTSPHLLYSSTVNLVTEDYSSIIDCIELLLAILGVRKEKIRRDRYKRFILFFSSDIMRDLSRVLEINKKVRENVMMRFSKRYLRHGSDDVFVLENL